MNNELLRKIGLTDGEIKVYEALINLGESSTGKIVDKSGISTSKVYPVLERLISKGLVSYIKKNNVKVFHVTNPKNITDYVNEKGEEIEQLKKDTKTFVKELNETLGSYDEETAQVYLGIKGITAAFQNLIDETKKGGEFLFFPTPELEQKKAINFFRNLQNQRRSKEILTKGLIHKKQKDSFKKDYGDLKGWKIKYLNIKLPHGIAIGSNRVIISLWDENPLAIEIRSERLTKRYKKFFERLWNQTK